MLTRMSAWGFDFQLFSLDLISGVLYSRNYPLGGRRPCQKRAHWTCGHGLKFSIPRPTSHSGEIAKRNALFFHNGINCLNAVARKEGKELGGPSVIAGLVPAISFGGAQVPQTGAGARGPFFQNELRRFSQAESVVACALVILAKQSHRAPPTPPPTDAAAIWRSQATATRRRRDHRRHRHLAKQSHRDRRCRAPPPTLHLGETKPPGLHRRRSLHRCCDLPPQRCAQIFPTVLSRARG
jgi:hypothetical protein